MRRFALAVAVAAVVASTPTLAAGTTDPAVMAPIQAFSAGMTTGDMAKAAGAHTASPVIIDEFPPHLWSGTTAFATWGADFGKDAAANGVTKPKLVIGKVKRALVEDAHAYVVTAADYSFTKKGKVTVEHATMTFVLDKTADGWKIAGWTFSY